MVRRNESGPAVGCSAWFGGNLAIDASLELQTPYSTKDTKNIPAVFPLFKPALFNRVMCLIWIPRTYSAVFVEISLVCLVDVVFYPPFWHNPVAWVCVGITQINKHPKVIFIGFGRHWLTANDT